MLVGTGGVTREGGELGDSVVLGGDGTDKLMECTGVEGDTETGGSTVWEVSGLGLGEGVSCWRVLFFPLSSCGIMYASPFPVP